MNVIAKFSLFLLSLVVLTSCFNPNRVQHISAKLVEIRPISLNSVTVVIEQQIKNDARKIEILDSKIDVNLNGKMVGKVFLEESLIIERGENSSLLVLKITLHTSIFNYEQLIDELTSVDASIYVDGYVKIKYGIIRKKLKIRRVPISPSQIIKRVSGIFKQ